MPTSITKANLNGQFRIDVNPQPFVLPALPAFTTTVARADFVLTSAGTYSGYIPAGVFSISGVAIGGGGGRGTPYGAGGGGALSHGSNIAVYPGNTFSIVAGAGGVSGTGGTSSVNVGGGSIVATGGAAASGTTNSTGTGAIAAGGTATGTYTGGGARITGVPGGTGQAGFAQRYNASTGYYYGGAGGGGGAGGYYYVNNGVYPYHAKGAEYGDAYTKGGGSIGYGGGQGGLMDRGGGSTLYGSNGQAYSLNPGNSSYGGIQARPGDSFGNGNGAGGGGSSSGTAGGARILWPGNTYYFWDGASTFPSVPSLGSQVFWAPNSPRDMPGIVAWYDQNSVSIDLNKWYDRMSNKGAADLVNCTLNLSTNANGATGTFYAVTGGVTSSITWPADLFPSSANYPPYGGRYTIFHVTRYAGANKQRIYSSTGVENWYSGHYAGSTGKFRHGTALTVSTSFDYGTNWFATTDQLNIGRTNGVTRETGTGLTVYPSQLGINKYASDGINVTEKSDFQTACLIVCSGAMPNVYYQTLETWLRNNYGITT